MKTVLVTGGATGIGRATVEHFAKNGYTVIFTYNTSENSAKELTANLVASGFDVHSLHCDLCDVAETLSAFSYVKRLFKHLDVLVNNAGVSLVKMAVDVSEHDYDAVMNVNAKGTFFACKYALEIGVKSIVNVASVWGLQGASCESVYAMSKHAVVGLTTSLARECEGVFVNCVCPPIVNTAMCSHLSNDEIADFNKQNGTVTYQPSDVAKVIFDLATSQKTGEIRQM